MDDYTIVACRLCGRLMRRYPFAVYRGDSSCCADCNKKVNNTKWDINDVEGGPKSYILKEKMKDDNTK